MNRGTKAHWLCKDCIIQNHVERTRCLSCHMPRDTVEIPDGPRKHLLMTRINEKYFAINDQRASL